jgi:NAD(P)-dependent dehydrogenase (short-subunit alcohol dehydrogenase family)
MSNYTTESTSTEVAATLASHIAGKVVLITGCSPKSLGTTAAMSMAVYNPALIILAGRNRSLIEETEKEILEAAPNAKTRILIFDLGNMKSVREAAAEVNAYPEKIDVLINSAGIMACPYSKTVDGFESQFGINHLGHFLFTMLIIGQLNHGGRVLNVSSTAFRLAGVQFEDPNFEVCCSFMVSKARLTIQTTPYDRWKSYAQSKTANLLFSEGFAERFASKGLFSFSFHVGGGTNYLSSLETSLNFCRYLYQPWKIHAS